MFLFLFNFFRQEKPKFINELTLKKKKNYTQKTRKKKEKKINHENTHHIQIDLLYFSLVFYLSLSLFILVFISYKYIIRIFYHFK